MIGVDISLRPWMWTAPHAGRWLFGDLPDTQEAPAALRHSLAQQGVHGRVIALSVPTRAITWHTLGGVRLSSSARRAATLDAAHRLRVTPQEIVVGITQGSEGAIYGAAARASIEQVMAPWLDAGFRIPVIEPAAVSLLRGIGSEIPAVVVRAGAGEVEIVAGTRDRIALARHLPGSWEDRTDAIRLEVEATKGTARNEGLLIERVLVSGRPGAETLLDTLGGKASLAALSPDYPMPDAPSWAIPAVSVALWYTRRHKVMPRLPRHTASLATVWARMTAKYARKQAPHAA